MSVFRFLTSAFSTFSVVDINVVGKLQRHEEARHGAAVTLLAPVVWLLFVVA